VRFSVRVPPYHVVSLLLLTLPTVALAQPGSLEPQPVARQLELRHTPHPEVWVAPAQATVVVLDARLDTEATRRALPAKGLRRVEVAEDTVVLVPAPGLKEGETLELPLWFAEGSLAQPMTLLLRVDSARAEPRVELFRGDIPAEALKRQVAALNARMEALRAQEASLTQMMAGGVLRPTGVRSHKLSSVKVQGQGLTASEGWLHVADGRLGLEVSLTLAPGSPPWVPATAQLQRFGHPETRLVRSMKLLSGAALQPGNTTRLLVEWETPPETKSLQYQLRVNERHGGRSVRMNFNPKPIVDTAPAKETKP